MKEKETLLDSYLMKTSGEKEEEEGLILCIVIFIIKIHEIVRGAHFFIFFYYFSNFRPKFHN